MDTTLHFQAIVDEDFANQLKELASGSGTYINQKRTKGKFVRPTPMVFLSNNPHLFGEEDDPTADPMFTNSCYVKLAFLYSQLYKYIAVSTFKAQQWRRARKRSLRPYSGKHT